MSGAPQVFGVVKEAIPAHPQAQRAASERFRRLSKLRIC
jgi:hypothetical protein